MKRLWILGASDPEMTAIEALLRAHGERISFAMADGTRRISASEAYRSTMFVDPVECSGCGGHPDPNHEGLAIEDGGTWGGLSGCGDLHTWRRLEIIHVECGLAFDGGPARCDHHRPGDRGFGAPPSDYWGASSIGQVCAILGVEPTEELRMVAAADHCLAAAYRGECPGVDPDALMRWRVTSRAAFQGRPEAEVLADLESTLAALRESPSIALSYGVHVRDMRTPDREPWPELPEAQCRSGIPYLAGPFVQPDGRSKITCCGPAEVVSAFLDEWAPAHGVTGTYGDPARGFAGGYVS